MLPVAAVSYQPCALPVAVLAATTTDNNHDSVRIAAGTLSLHDECVVEVIDIRLDEAQKGFSVTKPVDHLTTPTSRFPPCSLSFAPKSCPLANDILMLGGEAIAIWKLGRLVAYCSPAALNVTRQTLCGGPVDRPWTVTGVEWSQYSPDNILACHRDGPICVYQVERLPGAATKLQTRSKLARSESSFFGRLANSWLPKTPSRETPQRSSGATKAACEVITTIHDNSAGSKYHREYTHDDRYFSDARFLSSGKVVAAFQGGSDQVVLYDLRVAGTRKTPKWEASPVTPSKMLIEPNLHPHAICGLDRIHSALVLYDLRMSQNQPGNITTLAPASIFNSEDLVGDNCYINDACWSYMDGDPSSAERIHLACQPLEGGLPVPSVVSVNVHSFGSKMIETTAWCSADRKRAGLSVIKEGDIGVFASAVTQNEVDSTTMPVPPRGTSDTLRNERFSETTTWELGVVVSRRGGTS